MSDVKKSYITVTDYLANIAHELDDILEEKDIKDFLPVFDIMLQYSLIESVIVDLRFTEKEKEFVYQFRKYGDLVTYANKCGYSSIKWDNIADVSVDNTVSVLDNLRVSHLADDAGIVVATIIVALQRNPHTSQERFNIINKCIDDIFLALINFDVDTNAELIRLASSTPIYSALNYIANTLNINMNSPFKKEEDNK